MTTHSFSCPSCGAPVIPKGRATTVSCPYCRASVVVPEELRQVSKGAAQSTFVFDSFASNENNWLVGNHADKYFAKMNQTIADGRYRWEAQVSIASTITTSWLMGYPVSDFHLMVNCKHLKGSETGSSCGVVFRIQDNRNFYWFRITDSRQFAVSVDLDGKWQQLVDWTRTNTLKPYGFNRVEVKANETHFTFLINGQIVSEVDDDQFSQGLVGVAIEAYSPGEETTFDFMDFILRAS